MNRLAVRIKRDATRIRDNWRVMQVRNGFHDHNHHLRRSLTAAR
jgi:hypothetical protein